MESVANEYQEFLAKKQIIHKATGFTVSESAIHPILKPYQNALTRYALRKGRSEIGAGTGLGKTLMLLEFARFVHRHTMKSVLIVAPLYVAWQTIDMAKDLLEMTINYARNSSEIDKISITNYPRLKHFVNANLGGIVFDESSIFKGEASKYFQVAKQVCEGIDFRLCTSATPNPNSDEEISKQSEILGIMTTKEFEGNFLVNRQDGNKFQLSKEAIEGTRQENGNLTLADIQSLAVMKNKGKGKAERQGWQLRPHGKEKFYRWLASWLMAVKLPSDLGFSDEGYILPELVINPVFVDANYIPEGQLVFTGLGGVGDRSRVRKITMEERCLEAQRIIGDSTDQWIVWCGLNPEADRMKQLLDGKAINVQGSDKLEKKIEGIKSFIEGHTQILVSKTQICGHGSNFQHCHKMIFVGLSDSWEAFYQAIKRIHRFMQEHRCEVWVILSEEEREIWDNVVQKGERAELMTKKLIENAGEYQKEELDSTSAQKDVYTEDEYKTDKYWIMLGDSCERMKEIESNSVGLSVYSPPFGDLFIYSNSARDLGNNIDDIHFLKHYKFIVDELLRATMPGRLTVVHAADIHTRKKIDGYIGLKGLTHNIVKLYEDAGWHWKGSIPIAKNPQAAAIRLKAHELMFATMERDSIRLMPVQPDYLLVFAKPGQNPTPVLPTENLEMDRDDWIVRAGQNWLNTVDFKSLEEITENEFLEYAKEVYRNRGTIWKDIRETEVLQHKGKSGSRLDEDDIKHICPLQLDVVEWAIKLWSNPGETVFTPFMGIGTEVYQAVMFERYGIGIELKPEYFYKAHENIQEAVRLSTQEDFLSMLGIEV